MKAFIRLNKITAESMWTDRNPNMDDPKWQANHYKTTIRRPGKQMTVFFSKGLGLNGEPEPGEVLDCLAADAAGIENARSFEAWAGDYGYDTDSRKAEKTYRVCQSTREKLIKFLGQDLYKSLLWKTERL